MKIKVVTKKGLKVETFDSLEKAQEVYPELSLDGNGPNFTLAIRDGETIRFEDWETFNV